jgi:hypothetical protein
MNRKLKSLDKAIVTVGKIISSLKNQRPAKSCRYCGNEMAVVKTTMQASSASLEVQTTVYCSRYSI